MFLTTRIPVISTPIRASSTVIPTELNVPASREPLNENTDTRVALSTTILGRRNYIVHMLNCVKRSHIDTFFVNHL